MFRAASGLDKESYAAEWHENFHCQGHLFNCEEWGCYGHVFRPFGWTDATGHLHNYEAWNLHLVIWDCFVSVFWKSSAGYIKKRLKCISYEFYIYRKDGQPNFLTKAALGMVAGCVGAFVGTPAEVALIRMTADGRLSAGKMKKFSYVNVQQ